MTSTAFTNIAELTTNDGALGEGGLGLIKDAGFIVRDGVVEWVGAAADLPPADKLVDLSGLAVVPGFVDSHAHLVFAGDRADEFAARMAGQSYAAGGIRRTVELTRAATDEQLRGNASRLATELLRNGVTHFECKTGYGLTLNEELRELRIASEFTDDTTLLAAHVVPVEFADRPDDYVSLIVDELLPAAVATAKWVDVFCDRGAFTLAQTRRIFVRASQLGFGLRLHANQLQHTPGAVQLAVEFDAASVDHCTHLDPQDVSALAGSNTVATLLPAAEFSTRSTYPSARELLDAGVKVAIATDCNPGSSYTTSMPFCIALAVRELGMTVGEAVAAATAGGAAALRCSDRGGISSGMRADFLVLNAPSHLHLAYRPGVDIVNQVWQGGRLAVDKGALDADQTEHRSASAITRALGD